MANPGTRRILYADRLESTIGTLLLIHDRDGHVRALDFHDFESRMWRLLRLHYGAEGNDFAVEDRAAPTTIRWAISDYFSGDLCAVNSIPVTTGGTSFQREVWAALRTIEAGTTLSYGALARQLGRPKSVRAVGSANGANPVAIVVPCHRVIGADGSLTGYGGGISRKRWLLTHEGVALEQFAKQRIPEAAWIPEAELMQSRPERLYRPLPPQKDGEMNQVEKAARFSELHVKGAPLLLYNAWDAGTAKSILDAGAKAIATSSWAVAEAQGYGDGESIPITFVEQIIARIVSTIDAPVSVDFEGGYSDDNGALAENVARLLELGIIGINFEDRVVQGAGLYPIDQHARRIAAIREAARAEGVDLFINARTDLFLGQQRDPANSINDALDRAKAYAAAGASGFFIPGLRDDALIGHICDGVALPVNLMVMEGVPSTRRLSELGVARVSYGAIPYVRAMKALGEDARQVLP